MVRIASRKTPRDRYDESAVTSRRQCEVDDCGRAVERTSWQALRDSNRGVVVSMTMELEMTFSHSE